MFYIVRVWEPGGICEYRYDRLVDAQAHMQQTADHAELYVWLAGREMYMDSVGGCFYADDGYFHHQQANLQRYSGV